MKSLRYWFACLALLTCCAAVADEYPLRDAQECRVRDGLPNVFAKLEKGEAVKIAYLGGSITAQAGWRPQTLKWFQGQFSNAHVSEINAAIGGTGSDLGVFRLKHDVLNYGPDLLFVEFAVNDGGAPPHRIHQAMEGIVRQAYQFNPMMEICFVYTLVGDWTQTLRDGKFPRAASAMEAVADHYGIPSIHMGLKVAQLEGEGKLIFKVPKPKTQEEEKAVGDKILFSPDNVHPYPDSGHKLYTQAVARGMNAIRKITATRSHKLPQPFVKDHWQAAKMVPISRAKLSPEWERLDPEKSDLAKRFQNRLGDLYHADKAGATVRFSFKGTDLRMYDLLGPDCGQVSVTLDDEPAKTVARFDSYCTYHRLGSFNVGAGLPNEAHTVTIELSPDPLDKAEILSQRDNTINDPKRFADLAWYVGAILVIGDVVAMDE